MRQGRVGAISAHLETAPVPTFPKCGQKQRALLFSGTLPRPRLGTTAHVRPLLCVGQCCPQGTSFCFLVPSVAGLGFPRHVQPLLRLAGGGRGRDERLRGRVRPRALIAVACLGCLSRAPRPVFEATLETMAICEGDENAYEGHRAALSPDSPWAAQVRYPCVLRLPLTIFQCP